MRSNIQLAVYVSADTLSALLADCLKSIESHDTLEQSSDCANDFCFDRIEQLFGVA
jgi:hypothetical protein